MIAKAREEKVEKEERKLSMKEMMAAARTKKEESKAAPVVEK
jgi:hypothetical protein